MPWWAWILTGLFVVTVPIISFVVYVVLMNMGD